jgi:hypothetical protein
VPHLTNDGRKSFYSNLHGRARRRVVAAERTGAGTLAGPALFTVNGEPTDKRGLIAWLSQTFGASPMNNRRVVAPAAPVATSAPAPVAAVAPAAPSNGRVRP